MSMGVAAYVHRVMCQARPDLYWWFREIARGDVVVVYGVGDGDHRLRALGTIDNAAGIKGLLP